MGVKILQLLRINKDVLCLNLIRLVGITELMGVCVVCVSYCAVVSKQASNRKGRAGC